MLTQELLHSHAAQRVIRSRPDLAAVHDLSTMDGLTAVEAAVAGDGGTAVIAVVRRFELAAWVRGTVAFAARLDRDRAEDWRRSFTKTVFLAGNPANLADRFAFEHVDATGSLAWTAPAPTSAHLPLRQLLRAFAGGRELGGGADVVIDLPGPAPGRHRVLHVAGGGLPVAKVMVHLNHLLVEAVSDGVLAPGDRLTVRRVPRLLGVPGPFDALRVGVDPADPGRLHALMSLTTEVDSAQAEARLPRIA